MESLSAITAAFFFLTKSIAAALSRSPPHMSSSLKVDEDIREDLEHGDEWGDRQIYERLERKKGPDAED
ncbi:unnamed protein product [Cuscuta campestris]|uniref:Uncharacterized protein n=1 Tax=Cuscuta campestris TaxID=132261 RepID=A0A484LRT4_9ASTE|nr:unnamed protein product [Cuscuta campestris]